MWLLLIFFWLNAGGSASSPTPVTAPAPALTVSFERQSVRQNDCVNVVMLLANESEVELTKASFEVTAPSFFHWFDGRCEGSEEKDAGDAFSRPAAPAAPATVGLSLGSIPGRSPLKHEVHFHTGATIDVGEYNVLFRVPYQWQAQKQIAASFVSAEKVVKVNFLGNESVAGVPLALAGFIIPGLLFWLIIKAFGAKWSIDALSNQMIYSVMVSIVLVGIGVWLGYWDVSSGISIGKLTALAIVGASFGLVVGLVDLVIRRVNTSRRKERQINRGESEFDLLGKILELPSANRLRTPVITLKTGQVYAGSVGARTNVPGPAGTPDQEIVSLVSSYEIDWQKVRDPQQRQRMRRLRDAGRWREFVALAGQLKVIDSVQPIEMKNNANQYDATDFTFRQWEAADVSSTATGSETWLAKPLEAGDQ